MRRFDDLVSIVARLRGEGGCNWDRAQTPETLRPYLLEEAFEALDAIDRADDAAQQQEFGDLVFLATMLSQMAKERGAFSIDEVVDGVAEKMIRRHPHVFDPDHGNTSGDGNIPAWESRKAKERANKDSALDGVPRGLPALLRAHRISEKASAVGFDWPDRTSVLAKVHEELAELEGALQGGGSEEIGEEFGDLLFSLVNLGRFLPVAAEDALRKATGKFERRFRAVEASLQADGLDVHSCDPTTLEARWQAVKAAE